MTVFWATTLPAQQAFLTPIEQVGTHYKPPTYAETSQFMALDVAQLENIELGAELSLQISDRRQLRLNVVMLNSYINGDQVIRAEGRSDGLSLSLTLTSGQRSLFGSMSSGDEFFQIYAIANSDNALYQGWLYKPGKLVNHGYGFQNDFVIIDKVAKAMAIEKPEAKIISRLPLQTSAAAGLTNTASDGKDETTVSTPGINESNFRISQGFSRRNVIVGNSIDVNLEFENTGGKTHNGLYVEVFFVLENTRLLTAPGECRQQLSLSLQAVLYCELGDFQPNEKKMFTYSVATDESSRPRVISAVIMGDIRVDGVVNVVEDIRTDSDKDGISDFNEMLLGTDTANPGSVDHSNSVIDVLALYTPAAAALYPHSVQTRINQLISVANQIYADSGVGITLRPVYHGSVDYNDNDDMETALNHLMEKTHHAFAKVDELRETFGADVVMLFRPAQAGDGRCGLAPVGGFATNGDFSASVERQSAYSHIVVDCPVDTVAAHELGHNMGLTHSHLEDGSGGTFNFSTGYGVEGQFATVMAFPAAFTTQVRVPLFSSPSHDCLGFSCGVEADAEFGADAVQSLNLVRHQIANYYPTRVPDLPVTAISTLSGKSGDATISIAASSDGGLTFTNLVTTIDSVSLTANVEIDKRHLGMYGAIFVLVSLDGQDFFQFNEVGGIEEWDKTVEGLIAFSGLKFLRQSERVTIIDGFRFDPAFSNRRLFVYVAYWVESTGEVVYTRNPFTLNIN